MRNAIEIHGQARGAVGAAGLTPSEQANPDVGRLFETRLLQTIGAYDSDAANYEKRFRHVDLADHRSRFLARLPGRTDVVLDAGCGPGRDLRLFEEDDVRAIGVDRSAELLRIARAAGHNVLQADLRSIPIKSRTIAGIWACASLLHLSPAELAIALAEFKRLLQPSGNLFLSVRQGSGAEDRKDESGNIRWFYLYSVAFIEQLLLQMGFVDIDATVEPGVAHGTWVNVHASIVENHYSHADVCGAFASQ